MLRIASRTLRLIFLGVAAVIAFAFYVLITLPDVHQIKTCFKTKMYAVSLCPGSANYSPLNKISGHLKNAVVVSEDGSFYTHNGFDYFEIKTSIAQNLRSGGYHRGGSTITQQLAKNAFLTSEKSIVRKLKEAILTAKLEGLLSKNQILELYLNVVEFGPGIYGVKKASSYYFNKTPETLNALESAWLAFLLPNPDGYSASFRKKQLTPFARQGISKILQRLTAYQRLSQDQYAWARENIDSFPWVGIIEAPSIIIDDSPITIAPVETSPDVQELIEPAAEEEIEQALPAINDSDTI